MPIVVPSASGVVERLANRHDSPALGADTRAVLEAIGYDAAKIAALARRGVITIGAPS